MKEREGTRALAGNAEKSKKKKGHWQREGEKKGRINTAKRVRFCVRV